MQAPGLYFRALIIIPAIILGIFFSLLGDVRNVQNEWLNRNYAAAEAKITNHQVTINGPSIYDHDVEYEYLVGDRKINNSLQSTSDDERSFRLEGQKIKPAVGKKLMVYYATESPEIHSVLFDPSESYWSSFKRLAYATLTLLTCILIVVLVVVFYRPKKTDRYYLPAKIDANELKIDG
jgi:hypothetical protein